MSAMLVRDDQATLPAVYGPSGPSADDARFD
jgi:hypothetical protein